MSTEDDSKATSNPNDEAPLTPLQQAIRDRALATLEFAERQPKPSLRRKLTTGLMVVVIVALLLVAIDFGVRIMHRILLLWAVDDSSAPVATPQPLDPKQPFFISVDPPANSASSSAPAETPDSGMAAR